MKTKNIQNQIDITLIKVAEWYKWLHANPALSGMEFKTSEFVIKTLHSFGITDITQHATTGLHAVVDTGRVGKHIAFRAELDALPIDEKTAVDFKSRNSGVMHACGHDFHMAALLGVASVVAENRELLKGKISFVFQPSEEKLPGGAKQMLADGLFQNHKPDLIIAQHVFPDLHAGMVGFREGSYMASGDEIDVIVRGTGGHGALPHLCNDVVLTLAHTLVALQQVRSRFVNQNEAFVLSFGKMEANGANNILPHEAKMEGTMRTLSEEWRAKSKDQIRSIVQNTAKMFGCEGITDIREGYPVLKNHPEYTKKVKALAEQLFGAERVVDLPIRMTTDDFSYFAQQFPAVYYRVGVGHKKESDNYGLHTSQFLPDISALETAIKFPLEILLKLG